MNMWCVLMGNNNQPGEGNAPGWIPESWSPVGPMSLKVSVCSMDVEPQNQETVELEQEKASCSVGLQCQYA